MLLKSFASTITLFFSSSLCLLGQTVSTLQDQLDQVVVAFGSGEYAACYWQFEQMELDYGSEPEFLSPNFQQTILPLRAYAALMADRPTDALVFFDTLLRKYNSRSGLKAFLIYNKAIAESQTQALAAAAQSFHQFQKTFPNTNEASLALLQEANLRFEIDEVTQAEVLLDDFYASDAPKTLRMQARLRALQLAGKSHSTDRACQILFETDWHVDAMPDIAVLSFAALEAGDLFLEDGRYNEAIRAYRLVLPRDVLIKKQRERLHTIEAQFTRNTLFASRIWKNYYQQLINRLRKQLKLLETMADYTPGLYLRSGQAYLLGKRYREATILLRTVANSDDFDGDMRAEAHYRWTLALCEAGKWKEARDTARDFLQIHPTHKLVSSALFLVAHAYQLEGKPAEAIGVLDDLIENFPDDPQAPRWYFTRGYNFCGLENYSEARESFDVGIQRFPESDLAIKTKLWRGLSFFFERNYSESLKALNRLEQESRDHPLHPELLFRITNVHYAQRDFDKTLRDLDNFIREYPDHHRYAEACVLRGDSLMGLGELDQAIGAFSKVPDTDTKLFDYAVFQTMKIHKAQEHYEPMRTHLQSYIDRNDSSERPRVSEALYWIGWSLRQEQRGEEAFSLFEDALDRFGNDPKANAVGSILAAYADLYKRLNHGDTNSLNFDLWLRNATDESLQEGHLTRFARLTHFKAEQQRKTLGDVRANATLLSIDRFVPMEQQDPQTLAAVGRVFLERGYQLADDYYEYLLVEHPDHFERGAAYFGKAKLAANANRLESSRRWLRRFLEETPMHPLASEARILGANILMQQGLHSDAREALNEILQLKSLRGRPHAKALAGLARLETDLDDPKRAISYWQRIYTLYRAYPDSIVEAYWESAVLFERIGDLTAARNTLIELLDDERLASFEQYLFAQEKLPDLEGRLQTHNNLAAQELPEKALN